MARNALCVVGLILCFGPASVAAAHGGVGRLAGKHRMRSGAVKCPTNRGQVFVADNQAQVFVATNSAPTSVYYGCAYGSRHTYELGMPSDCVDVSLGECGGITNVVLAGSTVAYEESSNRPLAWWIIIRNLRNGRVLRRLRTNTPGPVNTLGSVEALVLKSNGAVAWVAQAHLPTAIPNGPREYEVYAADATGESRLLASGSGIEPASLALAGSTVYWTQQGHAVSAPLN
jgi:hypothetical protein